MRRRRRGGAVLALALISLAGLGATAPDAERDPVAESTKAMARLLQERAQAVDPAKLPYVVNGARADAIARKLRPGIPPAEAFGIRFDVASELVNAGRTAEALKAIDDLERDARAASPEAWKRAGPLLLLVKAAAYLRQGEEQNCHQGNNANSCLLPIRGGGIHRMKEGSTRAIEVLEEILRLDPTHLRARWLINVAHMTLGTYPDGVPEPQRIAPATFSPEHPLPRFDNVAKAAGLDVYGLSGGAIADDFDGDGRLDLMVSAIGFDDQLRLFRSEGDGRFTDATATAGLTGETGGLNLLQADYDNDGHKDALVLRGGWMGTEGRFPLSLLRNDGDGTFTDTTAAAGITHLAPTQTATFLDYDGDGLLDLFVGNESSPGAIHPCELYRNNGDGTFTERAREVGVDVVGFVKGVVSGDYDNDGRPDLYLSLGGQENQLLHNDGPQDGRGWRFTNVAREAGVTEPLASFPAVFFDYDNDGWLDLFVASYGAMAEDVAADYLGLPTKADRSRLFRNLGNGRFEDATKAAGLYRVLSGMGMNAGDLDNDGYLDLYVGTGNPDLSTLVPNRLFRNDSGRSFQDVTTAADMGHLQKGHGIAFADVDDDGDQDVFEQMGGAVAVDKAYSALYRNPGNGNGFVALELQGTRTNRGAIGARVKVVVEDDGGASRALYRTVGSGGSFGASPLRLHVGVGRAKRVVSAEVFWPVTGKTQALPGLRPGRRYRVVEGDPRVTEVKRPAFRLPGP